MLNSKHRNDEDRHDSAPPGRYQEEIAQEQGLSTATKVGIGVALLGLAALGVKTTVGGTLVSKSGESISRALSVNLSDLEKDIIKRHYDLRALKDEITTSRKIEKVLSVFEDQRFESISGQILEYSKTREGRGILAEAGEERLQKYLSGIDLSDVGLDSRELARRIADARILGKEDQEAISSLLERHNKKYIDALKEKYLTSDLKESFLLDSSGLRVLTVDDVLSGKVKYNFGQVEAITDKGRSILVGENNQNFIREALSKIVEEDPEFGQVSMGRGLFVTNELNQLVDLRGIYKGADDVMDAMGKIRLPVPMLEISPAKILRFDELRDARSRQPVFEMFRPGEVQINLSTDEKGFKIDQTLVKYGEDLFNLDSPEELVDSGFYSLPGIGNLLSGSHTNIAIHRDTPNWLDIGSDDNVSFFKRFWSKYINDAEHNLQPETLLESYATATGGELERIDKRFKTYLWRHTDALSDESLEFIQPYLENLYGESIDLSSDKKIIDSFIQIARSKVDSKELYSEEFSNIYNRLINTPEFNISDHQVSTMKKLLHKEFIRRINQGDKDIFEIIDSASNLSKRTRENLTNLAYEQMIDSLHPLDIQSLFTDIDPIRGQRFRSISEKALNSLNPLLSTSGSLVSAYPEFDLYKQSPRILVRKANLNPFESKFYEQFLAGRDNSSQYTTLSAIVHYPARRLNDLLSPVGLGLSNRSMGSPMQSYGNLFLKRLVPAAVGIAGIRYLSYEVGKLTGRSLEERGADLLGRIRTDLASARDSLGITKGSRRIFRMMPGAQDALTGLPGGKFLDPTKSKEETEEEIKYGQTEIRKGRWWPFGNTAIQGGATDYYAPSWYRRVKAQPIMTDVMYGSEDEYWKRHWLPTPRYPLAPIRRYITEPYYWEEKHYHTRPYPITGGFQEIHEIPVVGPLADRVLSGIFKPKRKMHKDIWDRESRKTELSRPDNIYAAGLVGSSTYKRREWGPIDIGADRARAAIDPSKESIVAVLDTGVDSSHPDLSGKVLPGYNTVNYTRDTRDRHGHGTHVSGIIAARDDGEGTTGVAPNVKILPVKVLGDRGTGSIQSILDGMDYAMNWEGPDGEKVDVINLSLGSRAIIPEYAEKMQEAREKGIVVVAAAGNDSSYVGDPASWPDTIAVSSTDKNRRLSWFSNWGPEIDLAAPGEDIISTTPGGRYKSLSGTSMSTPHVSAVAAMLRAEHPDLTADEVRYLMIRTAVDLGDPGKDQFFGHGLVQADKALEASSRMNRAFLRSKAYAVGREIDEERQEKLDLIYERNRAQIARMSGFTDEYGRPIKDPYSASETLRTSISNAQTLAGLYGFMTEQALGGPITTHPDELMADSRAMTSERRRFWDSDISGLSIDSSTMDFNEISRRVIGKDDKWHLRYNPIPNVMPDWMPGEDYFIDFHHGDPYVKLKRGEERLPGPGYEALYDVPGLRLEMRGSQMGKSLDEMVDYLSGKRPEFGKWMEDILEEGSAIHEEYQRKWDEEGKLHSAEVRFYNQEYNYSGHYDAMLYRSDGTLEVVDIKSMSDKRFQHAIETGRPYDEHFDQVNSYLAALGMKKGALFYVNRDRPEQTHWFTFDFDPVRFRESVERAEQAREIVRQKLASGEISRYDLYDDLNKFRILSDVAPYSKEYRELAKKMADPNKRAPEYNPESFRKIPEGYPEPEAFRIDAEIKRRLKQAEEQRTKLRLYPYQFRDSEIQKKAVTVKEVLDNQTFLTHEFPDTPIRMAGVKVSRSSEAKDFLDNYIHEGSNLVIGYAKDEIRRVSKDGTMKATVAPASVLARKRIRNINQELIKRGYAEETDEYSPADIHARFSQSEINLGKAWERFAHMDTIFHTKLLQVRSPLESYKRRDLYGKDWQPWTFKDIVVPTVESIASNNIFKAALTGAGIGALLVPGNSTAGAGYGAAIGATLSALRGINEAIKQEAWIPKRRRKEREIDEYFDTLEYMKYKGLYEKSRQEILEQEGYDIEEVAQEEHNRRYKSKHKEALSQANEAEKEKAKEPKGSNIPSAKDLPGYAQDALEYRERYRSTLRGMDFQEDWKERAYRALPDKDRKYFDYFLEAPERERKEILKLVPENQKNLYRHAWGMKKKELVPLPEYFKERYLPSPSWEGWRPEKALEDIKVKVVKQEGLDLSEFGLWREHEKRADYHNAPVIPIRQPTYSGANIQRKIEEILRGEGLEDVDVQISPSMGPGIKIFANISRDRRKDIEEYVDQNGIAYVF